MKQKKKIVEIYDTTLRDGAQGMGVSFSLEDKLRISEQLDDFGVHFIEAGWPNSNRTDHEYFRAIRKHNIKNAKITAFGRTRARGVTCARDVTIQALVKAQPDAVTIYGKSSESHTRCVLKAGLNENLKMISDSIRYLKKKGFITIFDAEHFFDGYFENREYALDTLRAAQDAGADRLVLCDTNGGCLPSMISEATCEVVELLSAPVGIHAHNDSDLAVANSLAAVEAGARQVHGTLNGYGERTGNANLCTIIPNLALKMGVECISPEKLSGLTRLANFTGELINKPLNQDMPFVGSAAFTHKGGTHMDAMRKLDCAYEHIKPELIGNSTRTVVSDVAGRSNVIHLAEQLGIDLKNKKAAVKDILGELKTLGYGGYQFEGAEGSFELIVRKHADTRRQFFSLEGFRVVVDRRGGQEIFSEATIKVVVEGSEELTVGEGNGPVDALNNALMKALQRFYPTLEEMRLTDYKVRVIDERSGTSAAVRVLITSRDNSSVWGTVGVSGNVIQASWKALIDSVEYKLLKDGVI